ncbi:MAG TPA: wax ester/triacylglycerol synthase domain-containing protein [Terriglobales bacterium]
MEKTEETVHPSSSSREYLSFGDALFLHLEQKGIPINIAAVAIMEGAVPMGDFFPYVEAKLSHVPRCMQRVVPAPFNLGLPRLEHDPDFDFRHHVHERTLRHGTDAELKTLSGELLSQNLDRAHPLWHLMLVHGLKGGRTALIARIHHSMADGISGVAFLNALMDRNPHGPVPPRKQVTPPRGIPRDPATTLIEAVTSSWFLTVQRLLSAQSELLNVARQMVAKPEPHAPLLAETQKHVPSMEELGRIFPEIATAPERLPFNVVCRGPQMFEWCDVPFEDLRAMKHAAGCSFNDVALAAIAATFRRYSEARGTDVRGRSLRIVVPVNTRPAGTNGEGMGNDITFVPIAVPLDVRHPRKLVAAVHERMTMIKAAKIAEMVNFAGALIAAIPSPVQVFLGPIAAQLPLTLCNLIFTNVPGPRETLYLLGHKLLKAYPYVPIGGEMGVNCAMLTYSGGAHFGFSCDIHATPDPQLLPKFLQESVEEMREAFGFKKAPKPRKARKTRKPAHVAAAKDTRAAELAVESQPELARAATAAD